MSLLLTSPQKAQNSDLLIPRFLLCFVSDYVPAIMLQMMVLRRKKKPSSPLQAINYWYFFLLSLWWGKKGCECWSVGSWKGSWWLRPKSVIFLSLAVWHSLRVNLTERALWFPALGMCLEKWRIELSTKVKERGIWCVLTVSYLLWTETQVTMPRCLSLASCPV